MTSTNNILIIKRDDLIQCDMLSLPIPPLQVEEVLVKIETFGLTSNNITYAALSKSMPYLEFFPVPDSTLAKDWGCLPVWGVGRVVQSNTATVPKDARVYGFFPAAGYVTLKPAKMITTGFRVDRPQIPDLFGFYNLYNLADLDPLYKSEQEAMMVIMRPLFLTGLLLTDYLTVFEFNGAEAVAISSAASKTSYGCALALRQASQIKLIGLASAVSKPFADALGIYDQVITYDDIPSLSKAQTVTYVDISGNVSVRQQLANHLGTGLKFVHAVGMTHWNEGTFSTENIGDKVESKVFFAPGWAARRQKEGGQAFMAGLLAGWNAQMAKVAEHFTVVRKEGKVAVKESYLNIAQGRLQPDEATVHNL